MVCYNPIPACYNKRQFEKTGKKEIHLVLHEKEKGDVKWLYNEKYFPHANYEYIYLPCRKCAGCRSDNSKMWMVRAVNELKLHKDNCFITLTYADDSPIVKDDPLCLASLRYRHFQNFMKRLRKRFNSPKLKYLMCGEYGPKNGRAHFHCILFNFDFPDKKLHHLDKNFRHYYSQSLQELWSTYDKKEKIFIPHGFVDLANCDIDCCAYVSQYVLKKLDIDEPPVFVDSYVDDDNVVHNIPLADRCPPMIRSSRNPSIGLEWYKKFGSSAVENGFIRIGERKLKTPDYYFKKFEVDNPEKFEIIKAKRDEKMKQYYKDNPVDYSKLATWCESHLYRIKKAIKDKLR